MRLSISCYKYYFNVSSIKKGKRIYLMYLIAIALLFARLISDKTDKSVFLFK